MKKNTNISSRSYSLIQLILGALAIALTVALTTTWALTVPGQQRADRLLATIQSAAAGVSGPDLTEYYDIVNYGLQESIDVLQNVQSRLGYTPVTGTNNPTTSNPVVTNPAVTPGSTGANPPSNTNGSTTTANACRWQYHAIAGPVGPTNADPRTTACTTTTNGTLALEIGTGRKAATCTCASATPPPATTVTPGTNGSTTANSCSWKGQPVFGPVGPVDIDIRTTACTTANNGAKAMELSNAKQVTAICSCTGVTPPPATTVNPGTNGSTTANSCSWRSQAVVGPVGPVSIDTRTTACTLANNGTKSVELGSRGQTVSICACPGVAPPTSAPKTVWSSNPNLSPLTNGTISMGNTLYGYIDGGDVNNTWACLTNPNSPNGCTNPSDYRQLTMTYAGQPDGWQISNGRIEFRSGLPSNGLPLGEYVGYARTGQYGTDTTQAKFILVGASSSNTTGTSGNSNGQRN